MRTQYICAPGCGQRGVTMLEVLITLVILAFGLLGLAGLQGRMQVAELEAYQRTQAIVLLQEMVDRLKANPKNSMSYVYTTGNAQQDCAALGTPTQANIDRCEWNNALLGAAETSGGSSLGAMIGAIGCVKNEKADMPREFLVSVVWQGLAPTVAPTSITNCGSGSYDPDTTRRALVARVTIACLQNVAGATTCVTP